MDSHDTAGTLWIVNEDKSALCQLCTLFQMTITMPGAPCIYYGDEIGMTGGHDPDCRAAFPWQDRSQWDEAMLAFHCRAIAMRHRYPVLSLGRIATLYADHTIYAFQRTTADASALIIFNNGHQAATVDLAVKALQGVNRRYRHVWQRGEEEMRDGKLTQVVVPARRRRVRVVDDR